MFPGPYFGATYYPEPYWPKVGAEQAETPLTASKLHVLTGPETRFHVLTGNPQTYELEV